MGTLGYTLCHVPMEASRGKSRPHLSEGHKAKPGSWDSPVVRALARTGWVITCRGEQELLLIAVPGIHE